MVIWHGEKGRKKTGGKIHIARKKRKYELGSLPMLTKIGKEKRKIADTKGGGYKVKASSVEFVNVLDPATNEIKRVKILHILENKANPHFVRRGIITKGTVVKTEIGNVRITSRPSQHGVVNAIALTTDEKKRE
jgi:small subunit ribosomal protein S8e